MTHPLARIALGCLLALAACSSSPPASTAPDGATSDTPADADAQDLAPPDVAQDVAPDIAQDVAQDVTAPDVATDVAMDAPPADDGVPARCLAQADCAARAEGHVCDTATGQCVPCAAGFRGSCMASEYCTAANRCEVGCGADADCAGDGGLTRCDLVRHVCAQCGADAHCPAGQVCQRGACAPGCTAERACPTGQSCCANACLDLSADPAHCGACAVACASGDNATAACAAGRCALTCAAGYADCDGDAANGCEAALNGNASCGRCGNACSGATPVCARSPDGSLACGTGCLGTQLRCGGGCVDPLADADHCGGCATACAAAPNASRACQLGACGLACNPGFADCDASAANGCETSTLTSVANCGACGTVCAAGAHASASCAEGRCVATCAAGYADCDGSAANGCETSTETSAANCGACGRACPDAANATATCASGACAIACAAGFADCDGSAANGCEASLASTGSCGRCGDACAGATPVCSAASGACVSGCAPTQARCGLSCEDTQTAVDHCGACGNACPEPTRAVRACVAGACAFACEAGYGDCDRAAINGCEVSLQTSARNCGACGTACAAGLECRGGACAPAYTSCKGILDAGLSVGDGVYTILLGGSATAVRCLMSADGGGWTLAGNYPYPGGAAGVAGWSSGARVGASFTDLSRAFKLSDVEINAMRTTGFRAHGVATTCVDGPCSIDTTLYWRPTCAYASGSNSPACYTAFRDVGFTVPQSSSAPCSWHWGLVASNCASSATMGTSHVGEHVFVGSYATYSHAYDGRAGENPSVQFWVR